MSTNKNTISDYSGVVRTSIEQNRGGKSAIHRIIEAYGFSNRQALCAHLGVSQSTMANRYARDTLPTDWIIICSLETGASLTWLAAGKGSPFLEVEESRIVILKKMKLTNGALEATGDFIQDKTSIPEGLADPFLVIDHKYSYLVDTYDGKIVDGTWLIEIDKVVSVRELIRFPGDRIRVENGKASFECQENELKVIGKIICRTEIV